MRKNALRLPKGGATAPPLPPLNPPLRMVNLLHQLSKVVWHEETVPKQWRKGLIVNLFKKGHKEDPGNHRGITLLSVVSKVFC